MKTAQILGLWARLEKMPGGRPLFNFILGRAVPYSGSICPKVLVLKPGNCSIQIKDRPRLRNHLQSVHAVALANLGELCSGLACVSSLPEDYKAIVKSLSIDFLKKARGTILAVSQVQLPELQEHQEINVSADLFDLSGEKVAVFHALWDVRKAKP